MAEVAGRRVRLVHLAGVLISSAVAVYFFNVVEDDFGLLEGFYVVSAVATIYGIGIAIGQLTHIQSISAERQKERQCMIASNLALTLRRLLDDIKRTDLEPTESNMEEWSKTLDTVIGALIDHQYELIDALGSRAACPSFLRENKNQLHALVDSPPASLMQNRSEVRRITETLRHTLNADINTLEKVSRRIPEYEELITD